MSASVALPALRLAVPPGLKPIAHSAMATEFVLHLGGHEPEYLQQAAAEAAREIDRLEDTLSFYREASDVTRLNRAPAGAEVAVSPDTMACLTLAAEATQLTGGAFDAFTGRAAVEAKQQEIPPHLAQAPAPGESDVPGPVISLQLEAGLVRKLRAGPWLDLGALGKGYALDAVARLLAEWDVTAGFLSAGGSSLRGLGDTECKLETSSPVPPILLPGGFCLGASGFGFQPGHIVDARPAGPATPAIRAVALASSAALADALSTAAILLQPEQILELIRQRPGTAFLHFQAGGRIRGYGAPFA